MKIPKQITREQAINELVKEMVETIIVEKDLSFFDFLLRQGHEGYETLDDERLIKLFNETFNCESAIIK